MECSFGYEGGGERGLLHIWKGYSCSVTPERMLLSSPVLQVALGSAHGLLLVEGSLCSLSATFPISADFDIWDHCTF